MGRLAVCVVALHILECAILVDVEDSLRRPLYEFFFDVSKFNHYALLMALAIMIPYCNAFESCGFQPASYTLASHVPIFLSMFLSRKMAACVVIGSTLGFLWLASQLLSLCAASHIIFALMGLTILNIIQAY